MPRTKWYRPIEVKPVTGLRDFLAFCSLPRNLYSGQLGFCPPLDAERWTLYSHKLNPFYQRVWSQRYLARQDRRLVGRIEALVFKEETPVDAAAGQFGSLDAIDDAKTVSALLATAERFVSSFGHELIQGPFSPSINTEVGLLVEGFAAKPVVYSPWHPPWLARHIETFGYAKIRDLFSYRYDFARDLNESGLRTRHELRNRISFRPIVLSRDADVDLITTLFNAGWSQSWGFVPLRHREFSSLSKLLKPVMTEEFAFFIMLDGKPIGFAIVIPNLLDLVNDLGGKILPFGAIRLVSRIIKARFHSARLDLLGLEPSFHGTAIGGAIIIEVIAELIRRATNAGISHVELGWVLEENEAMHRIVEWSGGLPDKVHRIYQKHLKHAQVP